MSLTFFRQARHGVVGTGCCPPGHWRACLFFGTDWLFPHTRQVLRIDEVANALAISEQQVRDLIDVGELSALPINDEPDPVRQHMRVLRASVVRFVERRQTLPGSPIGANP